VQDQRKKRVALEFCGTPKSSQANTTNGKGTSSLVPQPREKKGGFSR